MTAAESEGSGLPDAPDLAVHDVQKEPHAPVQGEPAVAHRPEQPASQPTAPQKTPQKASAVPGWAWLLLAPAATGALLLWRHLRQRQRGGDKVQPVQVPQKQVFSVLLRLAAPPAPLPGAPLPLAGRRLVVSDRLDVEGVQTRFGCDAWPDGRQPSPTSHAAVTALLSAGVQARAVVPGECLGLGPLLLDAGLPNPAGRGRSCGGGDFGAAVALAAGHADLALAVDELGSARVPAACCGVYAFRPTEGVLPLEGASTASHSLAVPALLARDPLVLLRAGEALRLPGGGPRGDVANYLVAEDFFSQCGERVRSSLPAVIQAVKRWAGPDQAQGLSLCEWLYHRVKGLRPFMEGEEGANGSGQQEGAPVRHTRGVLEALASVAETVRRWEFSQKYGEWVQGAAGSGGEGGGEGGGGSGGAALPQEVLDFQSEAQLVEESRYRAALAVMEELSSALRGALQEGYVFVLPTAPGDSPQSADAAHCEAFRARAAEFSALAALSGVPQVTLPLPVPGQLPLSISLLCLHKKDLTLLRAAAKLGPLLAEEAAKLAAEQAQQGAAGQRAAGGGQQAAAPAGSSSSSSSGSRAARGGGGKGSGGRRGSGGKKGSVDAEQKARAEACKEEGNAAFKAGRYDEAARQYSMAVQLDPQNHIYYANRAMAYLKLGLYGQAEADCDAALALDLNVKALLRRGSARVAQGNAEGAKADFKQALALEPQNRQAREELAAIQHMEAQLQPGGY